MKITKQARKIPVLRKFILQRPINLYFDEQLEKAKQVLEGKAEADDDTAELVSVIRDYAQRTNELELMKKQAENDALQNQINPHFLYNTLDTIRGQAIEDGSRETAEMIECLSRIFRYSIDRKQSMLTLEDELDNVRNYLKIQQYRFDNRFTAVFDVDTEDIGLMDVRIPKLTLQPLVENSIKHGLESYVEGGLITIRAYQTERFTFVQVEDNGKGIEAEKLKSINRSLREGAAGNVDVDRPGGGIAIHNVNRRIKFHFGNEYGLTLSCGETGGTLAEICLPNGGTGDAD